MANNTRHQPSCAPSPTYCPNNRKKIKIYIKNKPNLPKNTFFSQNFLIYGFFDQNTVFFGLKVQYFCRIVSFVWKLILKQRECQGGKSSKKYTKSLNSSKTVYFTKKLNFSKKEKNRKYLLLSIYRGAKGSIFWAKRRFKYLKLG